jgi:DNA repair exonuclease SbcCD nuclease subunit
VTAAVRVLHTADWQLGLRLNFVAGDAGARLRAQRFETVRRIAALAAERAVDAVLVAGDVFDDNAVGADTLQLTRDALTAFGDIPVVLLPGNHDPATPDSALRRLEGCGTNVHLALEREALRFGALEVLPCPLTRRHERDDPGAWVPARDEDAPVRVALAHGGALTFSEVTEAPNRIDVQALLGKGVDYVALGDWHGVFEVEGRAWYNPGHVLIVELDGPGTAPRVEAVQVARSRWLSERFEFTDDGDLDRFEAWLDGLEDKSWTLLRLILEGQLSLSARARLDDVLTDFAQRLAHLRLEANDVTLAPTEDDLATLHGEGYLGAAIRRLREEDDPANDDAMLLLYRLLAEAES